VRPGQVTGEYVRSGLEPPPYARPVLTRRVVRVAAYGVLERPGSTGGTGSTEVLLVRASASSDVPGTWWLPGGGLEPGESAEHAVVREVQEETGLVVRVAATPRVVCDVMEIPDKGVVVDSVRVCYPLELVGGHERAEADGSSDHLAWFPRSQVPALRTLPFVQRALDRATAEAERAAPGPDHRAVIVVEGGHVRVEVRPQM
jgi:ADP-ribose pyrophosphatase YjhB (NUDIX family)